MLKFFTIKNTGIFEVNKNENTHRDSLREAPVVHLLQLFFTCFLFFRIIQQTSKPLTYQPFSAYGSLIFLALLKSRR